MVAGLKELHSMRPDDNEVLVVLNLLNGAYPKAAKTALLTKPELKREHN